MEYTITDYLFSILLTLIVYDLLPVILSLTKKNLSLLTIRIISVFNYLFGYAFFYYLQSAQGATPNAGAALLWSVIGYALMKKRCFHPSEEQKQKSRENKSVRCENDKHLSQSSLSDNVPSDSVETSPLKVSSSPNEEMHVELDSYSDECVDSIGFSFVPHGFSDCYNMLVEILGTNHDNPSPIDELTIVTYISVYQFIYDKEICNDKNYISGTRMLFIDSILMTMFIFRAMCITLSRPTLAAHIFDSYYTSKVKKCLCLFSGESDEMINKIFNERVPLYDRVFMNENDFPAVMELYRNILIQDLAVKGYKPFDLSSEYVIDAFDKTKLYTQASAYFVSLPRLSEKTVNRVVNNFINK